MVNRFEVHLVNLDPTVGSEIQKTRPAVIIQNDVSNRFSPITIVAAISSQFADPPHPREVIIQPGKSGLSHTSAAVLVQENDDPALQTDLDQFLKQLAPRDKEYRHNDGNCDAHLKASLLGCSKTLLIEKGRLVLGRWQGVFFCEFDGPRRRELRVKIIPD